MATYLQGVTDYIPDYQPFQPDLNFYGNILQTKQTQYDTNWKALNNMYGQYYNAELTRDDNIKKRDEHLKNIEFNLKRVSQLDLSLEQNVTQATQVFKPFYEDKDLIKDMAYTKNYRSQINKAMAFKGSADGERNAMYWDTGVQALEFQREEFKKASSEEAANFGNSSYTPYVNTVKEAMKIAKEANLTVPGVEFGGQNGEWIIKTQNGQNLIEPLSSLFEATLGSDPRIQDVYATQAYVDRKSYAKTNAAQFGGNEDAAEMKYLEDSFNVLKQQSVQRYKTMQQSAKSYDAKINDLEEQIKNGSGDADTEAQLENLRMNKDILTKNLERAQKSAEMLDDGQSSTPSTSSGFKNPYGDLKSLRMKVDSGMASMLMQKDLGEAANIFAYQNADMDIEANPFAVNEQQHKLEMAEIAARGEQDRLTAAYKVKAESDQKKLDDGTHYKDESGQIIPYDNIENTYIKDQGSGGVTDEIDARKLSKTISKQQASKVGIPYVQNLLTVIDKLVASKQMSEKEASQILGHSNYKNISRQKFSDKLNQYGYYFLQNDIGHQDLSKIQSKFNSWTSKNSGLSTLKGEEYKNLQKSGLLFDDYTNYLKLNQKWNLDASKAVVKDLKSKGFKYAEFLFDEKGNRNSEKEFNQALLKSGKMSPEDLALVKNMQKEAAARAKRTAAVDKASGFNPVMDFIGNLAKPISKYLVNIDKMSPQSLYEGMFEKAMTKHFNYDDLTKAMNGSFSDAKVLKSKINKMPGLAPGMIDEGTGLFTMGATAISINPKYGKSKYIFNDVAGDIFSNFDLSNGKVSFNGISGTAYNEANSDKNAGAIAMLNAIRASMQDPKSKLGQFEVAVAPIAGGKAGTSAVTFYPSAAWLKQYRSSKGDNEDVLSGSQDNILSQDDYVNAATKGITFFMDSDKLDNDLYNNSYTSPLASYVQSAGPYVYQDPRDPRRSFKVEKNNIGTGDFIVTTTAPIYNPTTRSYDMKTIRNNVGVLGTNLETFRQQTIDSWDYLTQYNSDVYNGRY
jgi:hypothetical protein